MQTERFHWPLSPTNWKAVRRREMASAGTSRLLLLEILLPLLLLALLPTFQAGGADSPCSPRVVAAGEARECARALCLDVLDMAAGTEIVHQVQQANFAFVAAAIFE
mmetsp:Transcript_31492/g.98985  ORF Transcript_31492/g.98985 Transcript_31492/m.98985 type:complete len:107 (-) Transcript_31492:124-444(-)